MNEFKLGTPEWERSVRHVLDEVRLERVRQDEKWGPQNHNPAEWLMVLGEEVGEANKAALEARFAGEFYASDKPSGLIAYREELIQVAAVAVAMIERLPPSSILRAAPKKRLGRCSALASTPPVSTLPDDGTTVL